MEQGVFVAAVGEEAAGFAEEPERRRTVAAAWQGALQIRRALGLAGTGTAGTPAPWERSRPVWAVALALEAAGVTPAAKDGAGRWTRAGYRVRPADAEGVPGSVRVEWQGPADSPARREAQERLAECAGHLAAAGWRAEEYRGRAGSRFLEVVAGG
ncbi:hypothetical protein AB0M28_14410 [Streptomyces sp. NPDC051940]|uniref:hypothetical protein n=1 Tax=Streptomyces sp. NPDC051940 TaxID=3155675 RepID=UPI00341AD3FB